jgi:hypothetical protein
MDLRATGLNAAPLSRSTKGEPLATRVAPKPLYSTFSAIASLIPPRSLRVGAMHPPVQRPLRFQVRNATLARNAVATVRNAGELR